MTHRLRLAASLLLLTSLVSLPLASATPQIYVGALSVAGTGARCDSILTPVGWGIVVTGFTGSVNGNTVTNGWLVVVAQVGSLSCTPLPPTGYSVATTPGTSGYAWTGP